MNSVLKFYTQGGFLILHFKNTCFVVPHLDICLCLYKPLTTKLVEHEKFSQWKFVFLIKFPIKYTVSYTVVLTSYN